MCSISYPKKDLALYYHLRSYGISSQRSTTFEYLDVFSMYWCLINNETNLIKRQFVAYLQAMIIKEKVRSVMIQRRDDVTSFETWYLTRHPHGGHCR